MKYQPQRNNHYKIENEFRNEHEIKLSMTDKLSTLK